MLAGISYVLAISACVGLTVIVWRKGWGKASLLPVLVFFLLTIILGQSKPDNSKQYYAPLMSLYFCIMVALGLFGPKKPILSKSQRKIAELEKKVEELSKQKEGDEKAG
jgi:hypothetical protein